MKHNTFSSPSPSHGEDLESAEPLETEAGVSSAGAVCPLPPHPIQNCAILAEAFPPCRNRICSVGPFCEPYSIMVFAANRGPATCQMKKASFWGHVSSSHSWSAVCGCTDVHLYAQGLCALSLLPLRSREWGQSSRTLFLLGRIKVERNLAWAGAVSLSPYPLIFKQTIVNSMKRKGFCICSQ